MLTLGGLLGAWLLVVLDLAPLPLSTAQRQVIQTVPPPPSLQHSVRRSIRVPCSACASLPSCGVGKLPLWVLVSFGAYSLASIGYELFIFRECPDAYRELEKVAHAHCYCCRTATTSASAATHAACVAALRVVQDLRAARERLIKRGFRID